jgi:hypothetical protein
MATVKMASHLIMCRAITNHMRTTTVLLFAIIATALSGWSTIAESDRYILWDEDRKLSWDDFQGIVNHSSHADAATAINIKAKPFIQKKRIFYVVDAYFIPKQSWCRAKSENLLRHEQLHFDIAELYARKARKKISEFRQMGIRDVAEYNRAISKILQESNSVDVEYDFNTLHGTLPERQAAWEKNIALELKILENFSRANWK